MSALLVVTDLAFVSGRARELEDISFTLERGHSLCVIGDNGSGKTLLLRILCGLERPSEGRILYDCADVSNYPEREWRALRQNMGVVLEDVGLLSNLTLAENIVYPLIARGEPADRIQSSLEFALAYFDLYPWRYDAPHGLSAGLAKRALLARATICDPPLLLCDNLFEGLYAQPRKEIRQALARYVATRNLALLFTASSEEDAVMIKADILRL